ncbi:MAG TPA: carbohydrate ABC transporter permease [Acidimicrobiia bacterium]|nr:carbohydrate ABC transporter permease [Acidimicrobiia bacterium]
MTAVTEAPEVLVEPKRARRTKDPHNSFQASRTPAYLAVGLIALIWVIPALGILISSFRDPQAIRTSGWWTVIDDLFDAGTWTLQNYETVLRGEGFANAFVNSLAVTIPAVVIPITVAAFAAYAFAWMDFPGRTVLFAVVVGLIVVPLQMALIPILRIYVDLGVTGSFPGLWLAHTGFGLPLAVYLLRNYMGSLPSSLIESAEVDGADHYKIFTRLILPLSTPVLAAFATLQFLWVWNDYLVALVFLGVAAPQNNVLTVELAGLAGQFGEGAVSLLPAAAFISMVLPLVVFFLLQRYFVRGLTAGAVKG